MAAGVGYGPYTINTSFYFCEKHAMDYLEEMSVYRLLRDYCDCDMADDTDYDDLGAWDLYRALEDLESYLSDEQVPL